jgi:hypothetical protein
VTNLNSKRQVRTKTLATPREWQQLARQASILADESRRLGDYISHARWTEISRTLDPLDDETLHPSAAMVRSWEQEP